MPTPVPRTGRARRAASIPLAVLLAAAVAAPVAFADEPPPGPPAARVNTVASVASAPENVATAGTSASTTVSWKAVGAFPTDVTVATYDVERREVSITKRKRAYSAPTALVTATAQTSASFRGTKGSTYQFRVRNTDSLGAVGPWSAWTASSNTPLDDRTSSVIFGIGWKKKSAASRWSGTYRRASGSDRLMIVSSTGVSGFGVVTTTGRNYAWVNVYVDGRLKKKVSLRSSTTKHRRQVYSVVFKKPGQHDITLITRTKGKRTRVDLDAVVVRH